MAVPLAIQRRERTYCTRYKIISKGELLQLCIFFARPGKKDTQNEKYHAAAG
jgi:hypothetical protein